MYICKYINKLNSIMKSLILIFISFFSINFTYIWAQELYGDRLSPYIDGRGADLYNEANRTMLNPSLLSRSELQITEKHALRRKTMLIAEANRRLHFDILEKRRLAKKASRAQSHEDMIADAWNNSPTGRKDGRRWDELYGDEKNEFRIRYIEFYNRKKDTPRVIPVTSRFYISEEEFSSAWQKNPVSKRDGRTWDEIPEGREKDSLREKYRSFKQANEGWFNSDGNPFFDSEKFVAGI